MLALLAALSLSLRDYPGWSIVLDVLRTNQMVQALVASGGVASLSFALVSGYRAIMHFFRVRLWCSVTIENRDELFDKVSAAARHVQCMRAQWRPCACCQYEPRV